MHSYFLGPDGVMTRLQKLLLPQGVPEAILEGKTPSPAPRCDSIVLQRPVHGAQILEQRDSVMDSTHLCIMSGVVFNF